jgi:hypothetical protein
MTREEKLLAMEALWANLSRDEDSVDSPQWHANALTETARRVSNGTEESVDYEDAKRELRERCK